MHIKANPKCCFTACPVFSGSTRIILIFLLACIFHTELYAQEDDYQEPTEEEVNSALSSHTSQFALTKNYELGDGLNIVSRNARLRFTQSLQLLYGLNSLDNFNSINSQYNIRRARFAMVGWLFSDKVYFRIRLNLAENYQSSTSGTRSFNNTLQDALIEYRITPDQRINFGVRADYTDTREVRIEGESLQFIDRSAVFSAFDAVFDYGIRYYGMFRLGGSNILKPYISVTTGDGTAGLQKNYGGFKYGIRLDYLPFGLFTKGGEFYMDDLAYERTPKLVIGGIASYNVGASSAKGTNGGRYIYGDSAKNILLPNYFKTGIDYMFKYRGFFSLGDFVYTSATVPDGIAGEFNLNGNFTPYTGQTPEQIRNTVLNRLNLGTGINIQAGYMIDKWALGARYAHLHEAEQSADFAAMNRYYSFITTRYFYEHNLKAQLELGYQEYAEPNKTATSKGNIYGQILVTVQF